MSLRSIVKTFVPKKYILKTRFLVLGTVYKGNSRYCRCCNKWVRKFNSFGYGSNRRGNAQCPVCGSLERDRTVCCYLDNNKKRLFKNITRILHVAPERAIEYKLKTYVRNHCYLSIDLDADKANKIMNLTSLHLDDCSFDLIYCSNVLEHIANDRMAIKEMYRVLRPGGIAIILVPLSDTEITLEDFSITDPELRTLLYGQPDHVRLYGKDIKKKLNYQGFNVKMIRPVKNYLPKELMIEGLDKNEHIILCKKPFIMEGSHARKN